MALGVGLGSKRLGTRRRLMALGGLGAIWGMARQAQPVEAAHQTEDIGIGLVNPTAGTASTTTYLNTATGSSSAFIVSQATGSNGDAIGAFGGDSVAGFSAGTGLYAEGGNDAWTGQGASGVVANGGSASGTAGQFRRGGYGVEPRGGDAGGAGDGGDGVHAIGGSTSNAVRVAGTGVYGQGGLHLASTSALGGTGVHGVGGQNSSHTGRTGVGVLGQSGTREGVRGESTVGPGVLGVSGSYTGVYAQSTNHWGLYAQAPGYAGVFQGSVYIAGGLKLLGGFLTAVKHPDGSTRAAHGVASAEPLLEDVGRARLTNGVAQVDLEPTFAALVGSADYSVFPVPEGDCNGLFVSSRTPTGFQVRELRDGRSTLDFSYRIVAKRQDSERSRLAALPALELPAAVSLTPSPDTTPLSSKRTAPSGTAPVAPAPPRR